MGLSIRAASEADLLGLSAFMRAQGQERCSVEYLRHWYFRTPSGSASVIVGEMDGRVVGMATTNDHHFVRIGERALVGMPQKVLTDASMRGQGIFGKLYRASEQACLGRGTHFFLTVTNAASTPIFLGKFEYRQLPSPRMAVLLPAWGPVPLMDVDTPPEHRPRLTETWRMEKGRAHMEWRYRHHPLKEYIVAQVGTATEALGSIHLKRIWKKGIPVMLLMDLVPAQPDAERELLQMARRITLKHRAAALLCLEETWFAPSLRAAKVFERSSGFNWLVKGLDEAQTTQLLGQRFDLSFGDLDFF